MVVLRRSITWVTMVSSLLVFISIVSGQVSDSTIVVGKLEVESQIYVSYIEDMTHKLRIELAGTHCFEALPPWVYSAADPLPPPVPDYGRSFRERVNAVNDVLDRCHP